MKLGKTHRRNRIKNRIRKISFGLSDKPRLSVYRSNKEIYAQLIDDKKKVTLVSASSRDKDLEGTKENKTAKAFAVGKILGKKATNIGVTKICFDRSGYLYHGRVKSLAEGVREAGLKF